MLIADTLELVRNTLEAGMTTGVSECEDYYVKTWGRVPDEEPSSGDLPMAVVIFVSSQRRPFAVGEDVEEIALLALFYSKDDDIYSEDNKAIAMVNRAAEVLRADPTLGHKVIDTMPEIRMPLKPKYDGKGFNWKAELRCKVKVAVTC